METLLIGFAAVWLLLSGNNNFNALGATNVDVIMKKINSRNTMSVIDDMLKLASILFRCRSAIVII